MIFPLDEYQERWQRIYREMDLVGQQTAVIWQRSAGGYDRAGDLHWLCNYGSLASGQEPPAPPHLGVGFAALIFHDHQEPVLHVAESLDLVDRSQIATTHIEGHVNLPAGVAAALVAAGIEGAVVHNADDFLPVLFARELARLAPGITFQQDTGILYQAMRIKSTRELDAIRFGGEIITKAETALMEGLLRGESESESASRAAAEVVKAGGGIQRIGVAHGAKAESVFWSSGLYGYSTETPQVGDLARGWVYGPIYKGFWLDPGRTVVVGNKPSAGQRQLLESAVGVISQLVDAIKPGADSRDVGVLGDRLMMEAGNAMHTDYWNMYGHGFGKDFYMPPMIPRNGTYSDQCDTYEVGMAATVEIFLRHEGVGLATFECNGLVTEHGLQLLDKTPMLWW